MSLFRYIILSDIIITSFLKLAFFLDDCLAFGLLLTSSLVYIGLKEALILLSLGKIIFNYFGFADPIDFIAGEILELQVYNFKDLFLYFLLVPSLDKFSIIYSFLPL